MYTYIGLVIVGVLSRLLPHPANMTAVTASALLAGSLFGTARGIFVTACTMFLADAVLGFHGVMWATYGSLFLITFISSRVLRTRSALSLPAVSVAASLLFYIITNFAVWMEGIWYPMTLAGLIESYIAGLPFLRNSIVGDVVYTVLFFGVYAWVSDRENRYLTLEKILWKK